MFVVYQKTSTIVNRR